PARTAARFQAGTPPIPSIYAGVAGIGLLQETGVDDIRQHVLELNSRLLEGLDGLRATVATPRRPKRRGALVCVKSADATARGAGAGRGARTRGDRHVRT